MKICIACSSGGHLTEVLQLRSIFQKKKHFFVTFRRIDSEELAKNEKVFFIADPKRNPFALFTNFFQSLRIFLREKPDVVISSGAGVAVPICYIAKLFGKKVIFFESFCRLGGKSFSGRLVYPIADLFFVQWPEMQKYYPKAKVGSVF